MSGTAWEDVGMSWRAPAGASGLRGRILVPRDDLESPKLFFTLHSDGSARLLKRVAGVSHVAVEDGDGALNIAFTVGCEQRQLTVALASMASKYLRELLMARFNAYWSATLAPTHVGGAGACAA